MMNLQQSTRRHFFSQCSMGLGSIALGSLLGRDSARANGVKPFLPGKPHFTPKAKNVIYLFMGGGPSQLELYDWKPELAKRHGGDIPDELVKGKRFAFMNSTFKQNNKLRHFCAVVTTHDAFDSVILLAIFASSICPAAASSLPRHR